MPRRSVPNPWTAAERKALDRLRTPGDIQRLLETTPYSSEPIYRSPRSVLRDRKAHCFDGAMLAAAALERLGHEPLLVDLRAHRDDDHVLAVYRQDGRWGAIAKSNFVGLRGRAPVYLSLRELAMSYFEAYFNLERRLSLRSFSRPLKLRAFERLSWRTDSKARKRLEQRIFGKRILFTNRDWPVPDIVAAYRCQSDAEFGFRQLKDPHVVSFSPMHHWTDSKIRVHVSYCVLALAVAHLMRRHADHAGLHLSVRELLDQLAGIEETVLLYHDGGKGRPRVQRMLTEMTPTQQKLADLFDIHHYAPTR